MNGGFRRYCSNNGLSTVERRQFKQLVADVIREIFGTNLRHDLVDQEGHCCRGWTGLALKADDRLADSNRN